MWTFAKYEQRNKAEEETKNRTEMPLLRSQNNIDQIYLKKYQNSL